MTVRRLLLDLGNTRCKWILQLDGEATERGADTLSEVLAWTVAQPRGLSVLIASVASSEQNLALKERLEDSGHKVWFAQSLAEVDGLSNSYAEPGRMGVDRWLAMLGALQQARGQRFCVVDTGSALTIDLVDALGVHEGGYIIPGADLMERALLMDTDRVRFEEDLTYEALPGRSTAEAVRNGVLLAQAGAVASALKWAEATGPAPRLFLCGGFRQQLLPLLSDVSEPSPDLVFDGLLRQYQLL